MENISRLSQNGFAHLAHAISDDLLMALEGGFANLLDPTRAGGIPWYWLDAEGTRYPNRLNDLLRYLPHTMGALLQTPILCQLAGEVCGTPWLSVLESIIIKHPQIPYAVPLHRDMEHDTSYKLLTVGIYLDDVVAGGEIYFVPGSHRDRQPKGNRPTHTLRAKRGDIVVHNVQTLHGTTQNHGSNPIRTIYVELRPAAYFEANGRWTPAEVGMRHQLMQHIHAGAFSALAPFLEGRFLLEGAAYEEG